MSRPKKGIAWLTWKQLRKILEVTRVENGLLRDAWGVLHHAASRGSKMTLPIHIPCLPAGPEPSMVQGRQAHSALRIPRLDYL